MKATSTFLLLVFFPFLMADALDGRHPQDQKFISQRVQRVLQGGPQTFGGYTITPSPSIDQQCNQRGVNTNDFVQSDSDFNSGMTAVTGKYQGPRDQIVTSISAQNASPLSSDIGKAIGTVIAPIGVPLVFAVLSFLSLVFMIFYLIFTACCCKKKVCCMKPKVEGDPMSFGQKFVLVSSIILGLGLVIITIIWTVNVGSLVGSTKYFPCAVASLHSDIVYGYSDSQITFVGINGVQYMIQQVQATITNFASPANNPDMTAVRALNLGPNGDALNGKVDTLLNANSPTKSTTTMYRVDPTDANTNPDSIKAMDTTIGNTMRSEINQAVTLGKMLDTTAANVIDIATGGAASMNDAFNGLNSKIDPIKNQMNNMENAAVSSMPIDQVQKIMTSAMIIAIIFVILATVLYFVILYFNLFKNKLHGLKLINKFLMFIKIVLAVAFNLLVVFLAILCIIISNICYVTYMATTDSNFLATQFTQPTLQGLLQSCVMPNGSGDLSTLLNVSAMQDKIKQFNNTVGTFSAMDAQAAIFDTAGPATPPVGSQLDQLYQDSRDMKRDDMSTNPVYKMDTLINDINNILAGGNVFKYNGGCTGTPPTYTGSITSAYNDQTAANLCFPLNNIPMAGAPPRYTAAVASADPKYAKFVAILKKMRGSYGGLDGTSPNWVNSWQTGVYNPELSYFSDIKTAFGKIKNLRSQTVNLINFLSQFSGNLFKVINCRIMIKEVRTVQVAICTKFGGNLMATTTSMTAMSIFLFFFSWCICCGVRCTPQKEAGDPSKISPQTTSQAYQQPVNQIHPTNEMAKMPYDQPSVSP